MESSSPNYRPLEYEDRVSYEILLDLQEQSHDAAPGNLTDSTNDTSQRDNALVRPDLNFQAKHKTISLVRLLRHIGKNLLKAHEKKAALRCRRYSSTFKNSSHISS